MRCQQCVKENKLSALKEFVLPIALGLNPIHIDDEGKEHIHIPGKIVTEYQCSNGHNFKTESYNKCWCGWQGGTGAYIFLDKHRNETMSMTFRKMETEEEKS
jgi:hypothetical protein